MATKYQMPSSSHLPGPNNGPHKPSRPQTNPNVKIDTLGSKVVWCKNLHPDDLMYTEIENMITNDSIVIENIVKVENPFLRKAYHAKKKEKQALYGAVREELLFHGTKKCNVDNICRYNFDFRLFGTNKGHRFGQGVSFSPNAKYASWYSDDSYHKVMIVADVLIANVCDGDENMNLPPPGFDTSQKPGGSVIVKYEDNEFYPAYKLYYHMDEDDDTDSDDYTDSDEDDYTDSDEDDYTHSDDDDDSDDSYYEEDSNDYSEDDSDDYSEDYHKYKN
ncbi:pheromone-processing carboxypeptidase KEX1-like [Tribolium madens]|uniref:pheromone-processing carboxypeptidase KEX1-like n=1 Tax=Tribolium madens TaxID=41895 RepID=UPI001CF72763|nr:pheromone-processing carboxypeptidase KEX1-like [Tribolium madens]